MILNMSEHFLTSCRNINTNLFSHFRWSLKYGNYILGGLASLSGFVSLAYYRQAFNLKRFGRLATTLPTVTYPFVGTLFVSNLFVTDDLLLDKTRCPLCVEIRGASIQTFCGVLQPAFLAMLVSIVCCKTYYTMPFPAFKDARAVMSTLMKMSAGLKVPLAVMISINILGSMFIIQEQGKQFELVKKEVQKDFS